MICKMEKCTGCMACYNKCPVNAIKMQEDEEGFLRPIIDEEKCIHCNLCKNICPANVSEKYQDNGYEEKAYACWSYCDKIRKESTSGGIFTILSEKVIEENGVVYGAMFDSKINVVHDKVETKETLEKMRGSKYVQSNIGNSYQKVEEDIKKGKLVLFTGTPCQVEGLYCFLGNKPQNLITCDLVCHGVPSAKIFEDYKNWIQNKYDSLIQNIQFRYKKPGWEVYSMKIDLKNRKQYRKTTYQDPYSRGFLRNLYLRPSCHICEYTTVKRNSDFTIADFWGYQSNNKMYRDDDKGISLVITHNIHAEEFLKKCNNKMKCIEKPIQEAIDGNPALSKPFPMAEKRKEFWKDYQKIGFEGVIDKYLYPEKHSLKAKVRIVLGKRFCSIIDNTKKKIKSLIKK